MQQWQSVVLNKTTRQALSNSTIHIWLAYFSDWQGQKPALLENLSEEERRRAGRFRKEALATRYILGRGLLRVLLATYTGIPAPQIDIKTNAYSKPMLSKKLLTFNLAHNDRLVMYAFAKQHPVGIDVEAESPIQQSEARRILTDAEWAHWQTLSKADRQHAFFRTWVRKEAVLKALGVGLSIEPDTFSVANASQLKQAVRVMGTTLTIVDLPLNAPLYGAVATNDMEATLCYFVAQSAG